MRKYFGTDGVRGVANSDLSAEFAYRVGAAGAFVLKKHQQSSSETVKIVIGTDTRISKDMLSSAIAAGVMSVGVDVIDVGIAPTPAVAYLTRKYGADAGVVISASHNPAEYNGIKFFDSKGFKLPDELEEEIEYYMEHPPERKAEKVGRKVEEHEARSAYSSFVASCIENNLSGLNVTIDCSNGAAYSIAPEVFESLGAKVHVIGNSPDGYNINLNCGSTHMEALREAVIRNSSDIGIAYDGDADRFLAIDEKGEIVDGDKLLLIAAKNFKKKGKLKNNTLVVTVMSNLGLKIAAQELGIDLSITAVGDRYVLADMLEKDYCIGGEQSGHMIFSDYNTTGDGILSSLIICNIMKEEGKKLNELASIMEVYPQILINAKVKPENKNSYLDDIDIQNEIKRIEEVFHGKGRVLIRPSGTEPLVRVMIEGKDIQIIEKEAKNLVSLIESKLS
ncbi:phosphoglucosamine mutase [Filifactor villosus]|uniref:Phosphoglucosamine mutase n=1 Tax=Filifactor villosus TaxID=29374 RepID=A0ABV9QKH6_9FIRM